MRVGLLILISWLVAGPAGAKSPVELLQEGHVRVRVSAEPGRRVVIGQQTRFHVEILTDTWFTSAPAYPELTLDGAVALMPEQLGTNFTERIDGVTFAAQRRSYVIFPQRAGPLQIPSLRVRLAVSQDAKAGKPFTLRTPPLRLSVVLPAEAEGVEGLVTTPTLRVRETWSRPLEGLTVGDAIQRSVRMEADRSLGMMLPDLEFVVPDGIASYPDQPRLKDHVNRGRYRGERVEAVTYVLQRAGSFTLPAIEVSWWSPGGSSLRTETLEARTFEVGAAAAGDHAAGAAGPAAPWRDLVEWVHRALRAHGALLLIAALAVLLAVRLLQRTLPIARAWRRNVQQRRRESEAAAFREVERSLRRGDVDELIQAAWHWRARLLAECPGAGARADAALETSGLGEAWRRLERRRYGGGEAEIDLRRLRTSLRAFRRAVRRLPAAEPASLGALNPGSGAP